MAQWLDMSGRPTDAVRPNQRKIDYDRGVIKSWSPSASTWVYQYTDTPGVYLDAQGRPVSDDIARTAGFDVARGQAERRRNERLVKARSEIEAMATEELKRIAEEGEEPVPMPEAQRKHMARQAVRAAEQASARKRAADALIDPATGDIRKDPKR